MHTANKATDHYWASLPDKPKRRNSSTSSNTRHFLAMASMMVNWNMWFGIPITGKQDEPRKKMIEERHDRSGVAYTLYLDSQGNGHPLYPSILADYSLHLDSIREFNVRSDDVILLGYPKSGNHWLFEILTMAMYQSADYTEHTLGNSIMDGCHLDDLDAKPSPRVLVSHLPSHYLPKQITKKKTKMVLILRNPKDIMVSFYDFVKAIQICAPYRGTFDDFFELALDGQFAHGRWIDHVKSYDSFIKQFPDHPIHIVTYENMKTEPRKEIQRLCHFLGQTDTSNELLEAIVEKTTFATMREALNAGKLADMKRVFEKGAPGIFRKGIIGDWKHRLSESQNLEIERHFWLYAQGSKLASMVDVDFNLSRKKAKVTDRVSECGNE